MEANKLSSYVDALMAIIITIMVLEIKPPESFAADGLIHAAQPLVAYSISFFVLWTSWYSFHLIVKNMREVTYKFYWLMGGHMFIVSLFPVLTEYIGEDFMALLPELLFFILTITALTYYHFLLEPAALKLTNEKNRPKVHYNRGINIIRIIMVVLNVTFISFFPPISLVTILVMTGIHVVEHSQAEKTS